MQSEGNTNLEGGFGSMEGVNDFQAWVLNWHQIDNSEGGQDSLGRGSFRHGATAMLGTAVQQTFSVLTPHT